MPLGCSFASQATKSPSGGCGAEDASPTYGQTVGLAHVESDGTNVRCMASTLMPIQSQAPRSISRHSRDAQAKARTKEMCREATLSFAIR